MDDRLAACEAAATTCGDDTMTTLARWNPFRSVARLDPTAGFDEFFRGLAARPLWRELEAAPDMRIDVSEDDGAFHVKADIPGVSKDDIEVSVEGSQVAIGAEVKRETQKKENRKDLCTERYCGQVFRSFTLPAEVDSAKAEAHYENGVLTLDLPKKANGSSRRIAVN